MGFLGIGAQKAGTTWVFKRLAMHPQIYFPMGKEVHFWDNKRPKRIWDNKRPMRLPEYTRAFITSRFAKENGFVTGEITPAYAHLPADVIRNVKKFNANTRVFYVVRNPIDRVWSAVKHNFRMRRMDISVATVDVYLEELAKSATSEHNSYAENVQRWRTSFPDMLVQDYQDLCQQPREFLVELAKHVDIDPHFYEILPIELVQEIVHSSSGGKLSEEIFEVGKRALRDEILSFQDIIGRDLSSWLEYDKL